MTLLKFGVTALDEVARQSSVLFGSIFPDKMSAIDDIEPALRQSSMQAFRIGDRNEGVVPTYGQLARDCNLGEAGGEARKSLRIVSNEGHRIPELLSSIGGDVIL